MPFKGMPYGDGTAEVMLLSFRECDELNVIITSLGCDVTYCMEVLPIFIIELNRPQAIHNNDPHPFKLWILWDRMC